MHLVTPTRLLRSTACLCLLLLLTPAAWAQLLSEDFENGGNLPAGWTSQPTFTGEEWLFGLDTDPDDSGLFYGAEEDHTTGTGFLAFIDDSPFDFGQPGLLTPPVDLTGTEGTGLAFWYQNAGPDTDPDESISVLAVDVSVDGGSTFETINANRLVITERVDEWTEFVVSLTPYLDQSNLVVRFRGIENGNNVNNSDPSLDDVRIEENLVDDDPPVFVDTHVFEVNSLGDDADETLLDGRCLTAKDECTLRSAIAQANANGNRPGGPGGEVPDSIRFGDVPTPSGLATFQPSLPYLQINDPVVIDGYTAPGYDDSDPNALVDPVVVIDGSNLSGDLDGQVGGLSIGNDADGSTVRGLAIGNVPNDGIITLGAATGLTLQGNYIGVSADGTTPQPNTRVGVRINGPGNLIGQRLFADSTVAGRGNIIAASGGEDLGGVGLHINGDNNEVYGNFIGTNLDGDDLGNEADGLVLSAAGIIAADDNRVGAEAAPNTIHFNAGAGVVLTGGRSPFSGPSVGNTIRFNRIRDNGGIGIDIGNPDADGGDGITPNDPGDPDGNDLNNRAQNFPEIDEAVFGGGTLTVTYLVDSAPANAAYPVTVDFYAAADVDSREGALYLGTDVYNQPQALVTATVELRNEVPDGASLVATATDAEGNTSEFSAGAPLPVASEEAAAPAERYTLRAVYPNPFRGDATVAFTLREAEPVVLALYDALGRRVRVLYDGTPPAGEPQTVTVEADGLPSGLYLVRLEGEGFSAAQPVVRVR